MKRSMLVSPLVLACASLSLAAIQPPKDAKHADKQPEVKAPAGWTDAEMQACMEAGMPGANHQILAKSVGAWHGKTSMWMAPGGEAMSAECAMTVSDFMDGRFTRWEMSSDVPGMGPMKGMGLYGYDNTAGKFVASWVTNCGTNIMNGTGELSSDGTTFTWSYSMLDPISKKPTAMRDVERHTGPDSFTLETWGQDHKSGKEFKMMSATFTRVGAAKAAISTVSDRTAEIGCASCVYHMDGVKGCALAVKMDGKTYLVDGAKVDMDKWCKKSVPAVVNGSVADGRFVATSVDVK